VTQPDAVVTADDGTTGVVTQPDAVVTADDGTTDVVTKDVVAKDEGTKGVDEGNGLVRNSPNFSPDTTILPVGSTPGAGAGGWDLFQGIKDAVAQLGGGGGSLTDSANATDGGAENGGEG
jgi:hypothetical protein